MEEECPEDIAETGPDVSNGNPVYRLENRHVVIQQFILVLGEVTDIDIVSALQGSLEIYLVEDHPCECRFPFAVPSHESNLFAPLDLH